MPDTPRRSTSFASRYRNELGLVGAIILVLGVTLIFNQDYYREAGRSGRDILEQAGLLGIFALGTAIVIIAGGIDLSSGSVIVFAGSVCALVLKILAPENLAHLGEESMVAWLLGGSFIRVTLAILAALLSGFLVGTLHTWLITVVKLPPFVATLASLVGLRSLSKLVNQQVTAQLGGQQTKVRVDEPFFERISTFTAKDALDWPLMQWLGNLPIIKGMIENSPEWLQVRFLLEWISVPLVVFLILALACWILMNCTVTGRHIYALGGNEQAARLSGIRTERMKWLAYSLSGVMSAMAGVLFVAKIGAANPSTLAVGYELNAIAAAVVGGCSLQGGIGSIPGVMLGVLFLRVVIDAVAKIVKAGSDDYQGVIVGFLVVLAVAFNELRNQVAGAGTRFFPGWLGVFTIGILGLLTGVVAYLFRGPTGQGLLLGLLVGGATALLLAVFKVVEGRQRSS